MKINDYKIGTSLITTCTKHISKNNQIFYKSFGISKEHAYMYGDKPENIINCKITIIEEDVLIGNKFKDKNYDSNSIDYFALITWQDDGSLNIGLMYHNIKVYNICFPYEIDKHLFYNEDNIEINYHTGEKIIKHKKGDRRRMTIRFKVEEL